MSATTTIQVAKDGPYLVTGCRVLKGLGGEAYESEGTIALCRCDASSNKPYCDGTHAKMGFSGAKEADRAADERVDYEGDGVEHRDRGDDPMILVAPNGPYAVKGGADLEEVDQHDIEWGEGASREHFDLCRCGHGKNKPFCNGAHWDHPFDEQGA